MNCRFCGKKIRPDRRRPHRENAPTYGTPPGLDPVADGHPWYCDAEASAPEHRHKPADEQLDHGTCVSVGYWLFVAHTHEGQTGFWAFPSEVEDLAR